MPTKSPKQQLLEARYDGDLAAYVADLIAGGASWRTIAADVSKVTRLTVSHESLRSWYGVERAA